MFAIELKHQHLCFGIISTILLRLAQIILRKTNFLKDVSLSGLWWRKNKHSPDIFIF